MAVLGEEKGRNRNRALAQWVRLGVRVRSSLYDSSTRTRDKTMDGDGEECKGLKAQKRMGTRRVEGGRSGRRRAEVWGCEWRAEGEER